MRCTSCYHGKTREGVDRLRHSFVREFGRNGVASFMDDLIPAIEESATVFECRAGAWQRDSRVLATR